MVFDITDMNYFRLVRRTDPTYTAVTAIKEWLHWNPKMSVELAEEIWPDMDPDSFPMDWGAMESYLRGLDPVDAFYVGYYSHPDCNVYDEYYVIDAYGHFSSMNDAEYEDACVEFMTDNGYHAILDGDYPAPRELAEVLALWGETVRTDNKRPSSKSKSSSKPTGKKTASKNRKQTSAFKNTRSAETKTKTVRPKPSERCRA